MPDPSSALIDRRRSSLRPLLVFAMALASNTGWRGLSTTPSSIHVNGEVARALLPNCVNRVRASGGTIRLMFNVGAVTKEVGVGGDGGGRLMIFHGPLHLGSVNVPAIKGASSLLRGRDGVFEAGNRY